MKARKLYFSLFVFFVLSVNPLFAAETDVVINEFLANPSASEDTEFIEIYNSGTEVINISGWKLDDVLDAGSSVFIIPDNTVISSTGYLVFYKLQTGISLNNSGGDFVRLLNSSDEVRDSYEYTSSMLDDEAWGRFPDGTGEWIELEKASPNESNTVVPTSTPSPTNTPTPTKTPTPTNVPPTPTKTPTPTRTPTPVPDASPTPTSTPTPIPTNTPVPKKSRILDLFLPTASPEAQTENILGEATSSAEGLNLDLGGVFMSLGGLFVTGAGLYVVRKENNK